LGWNFDAPHNSKIIWDNLLNQSSDWSGTLFDYMIGQTARLKKEVLTIGKTGNSMNQEPSLNIMMYALTCSPILYCKFEKTIARDT
jgi:hypothetical protein